MPAPVPPLEGSCDPRFERVREAFAANFALHQEVGAAVCIRVGGRCVVDLWGGWANEARTRPWRADTLVNAYSVGKGVLAVLLLTCVERRALDLDAPVSRYWPEFAAEGKEAISVRTLLCHQAGLPAVRERLADGSAYDWDAMCRALASQAPWWEPGRAHGYHVNTFGFLVGELVRRATGLDVGAALRERVAAPANADFHFGVPDAEHARVAELLFHTQEPQGEAAWAMAFPPTGDAGHDRMIWHAYFNPPGASGIGRINSVEWRRSLIPSTSGHGSARGVAAIYDALLGGRGAGAVGIGAELRAEATWIHSDGPDRVLDRPSRFGLGFQLSQPTRALGTGERAFGHFGNGGSLGFADPDAEVAFGYLMNRPGARWQTERVRALIDSLSACL